MRVHKKSIVIFSIIMIASLIILSLPYFYKSIKYPDLIENILYGIYTGSLITTISSSILYFIEKTKVLYGFSTEVSGTYYKLSYIYSELIKLKDLISTDQTRILNLPYIYKIFEGYINNGKLKEHFNNYDSFFIKKYIIKYINPKSVHIIVKIQDLLNINNDYSILYNEILQDKLNLELAANEKDLEKIKHFENKLLNQLEYSLSTIPKQLAIIDWSFASHNKQLKFINGWNKEKDILLEKFNLQNNQTIKNEEISMKKEMHKKDDVKDIKIIDNLFLDDGVYFDVQSKQWIEEFIKLLGELSGLTILFLIFSYIGQFISQYSQLIEDKLSINLGNEFNTSYLYSIFVIPVLFSLKKYINMFDSLFVKILFNDNSITIKRGFLYKHLDKLYIKDIDNIELYKSLFGKIFGYSNITFYSHGGLVSLSYIKNTNSNYDKVSKIMEYVKDKQ